MVYVDTSVLMALIVREPHGAAVARRSSSARQRCSPSTPLRSVAETRELAPLLP